MTKHTQGPWEITAEHIITGNSEYIAWLDESTVPETEWRANARLIAAAPELLDLLREAEKFCPVLLQDRIRLAIAKTGNRSL